MKFMIAENLIIICAWCERVWNGEEWVTEDIQTIPKEKQTHGICPDCKQKHFSEEGV